MRCCFYFYLRRDQTLIEYFRFNKAIHKTLQLQRKKWNEIENSSMTIPMDFGCNRKVHAMSSRMSLFSIWFDSHYATRLIHTQLTCPSSQCTLTYYDLRDVTAKHQWFAIASANFKAKHFLPFLHFGVREFRDVKFPHLLMAARSKCRHGQRPKAITAHRQRTTICPIESNRIETATNIAARSFRCIRFT